MTTLLHFVASWAKPICEPHRSEVRAAANVLGAEVIEVDVDEDPKLTKRFVVPNVPAVAVEGKPDSLIVGAASSTVLVARLRTFVRLYRSAARACSASGILCGCRTASVMTIRSGHRCAPTPGVHSQD